MEEEKIKKALAERAKDGKITCAEALAVARELKISPNSFAMILTGMNIKIVQCQLSCFP